MKRAALVSSFSGAAQTIVNIGLLLVTFPLFISRLGLPAYGVYALITAVGSLGVFTNFGFNGSLIKYLAEQESRKESNYDIAVAFIIIGGSSTILALVALGFNNVVLTGVLGLSPEIVTPSVRSFYCACVAANVFQISGQVPGTVLDAQQKVYITNTVQGIVGAASKVLIIVSLLLAPDLALVGWIMFGSSFVGMMVLGWYARRTWGSMRCPGLRGRFGPVARKHFSYGKSIYATSVMGFFYEPLTKVLISRYVGIAEVGFFDIALRIKGLLWSILERLLYPVLPMIARTPGEGEARRLIEEVQHKLIVIVVPVCVATLFLTQPLIFVWLGAALPPVVVSVVSVVSCYLVALIFVPVYQFLLMKGYPRKTLVLQSTNVGVEIAAFACLVPLFGYYGALAGYCLAIMSSISLSVWYQHSILHSAPVASREFGIRIITMGGVLAVVAGSASILSTGVWMRIAAVTLTTCGATIYLLRRLKMITAQDVERYVGRDNRVGLMLEKLLVQGV